MFGFLYFDIVNINIVNNEKSLEIKYANLGDDYDNLNDDFADLDMSSTEHNVIADRDSYTDSLNPTFNYGSEKSLKAGRYFGANNYYETYIHFSFGGVSQGWKNTKIIIYVNPHIFAVDHFDVWEVSNNWEESEISWSYHNRFSNLFQYILHLLFLY